MWLCSAARSAAASSVSALVLPPPSEALITYISGRAGRSRPAISTGNLLAGKRSHRNDGTSVSRHNESIRFFFPPRSSEEDSQLAGATGGFKAMPQGDKSSYTSKQKRKAEHIEEGYKKRGTSKKEAERRAWATVNTEDKGGKKSGSGRG